MNPIDPMRNRVQSIVKASDLVFDSSYQREHNIEHHRKLVIAFQKSYNDAAFQALAVSSRKTPEGPMLVCFDGQHRAKALQEVTGDPHIMVPCNISFDLSLEQEADAFDLLNSRGFGVRRELTAVEMFRARLIARRAGTQEVVQAVSDSGWALDLNGALEKIGLPSFDEDRPKINAVVALHYCQQKYGTAPLRSTLSTLAKSFGYDTNVPKDSIIRGVSRYFFQYEISEKEMSEALGTDYNDFEKACWKHKGNGQAIHTRRTFTPAHVFTELGSRLGI